MSGNKRVDGNCGIMMRKLKGQMDRGIMMGIIMMLK